LGDKLKKGWIALILGVIFSLTILIIEIILSAVTDVSWWWFGGTFMFLFFMSLIITIVVLVIKYQRRIPIEDRIKPKDALQIIKEKIREDEDNSDEFINVSPQYSHEGIQGIDPTKILHLKGDLFWSDRNCDVIFNVKNPDEATILYDASEKEVEKAILKMAERPAVEDVSEDVTEIDEFGRPIHKRITRRMSKAEIQKKEEEKKEEEVEAL